MADDHRAIDREAFIAAIVLLVAFALIGLLWPYEPVTRSGPFWSPRDWERNHGGLGVRP